MIKTLYICDCCKKEVVCQDLITVKLPFQVSKEATKVFKSVKATKLKCNSSKEFEICQECAKKIVDGYRDKGINLSHNLNCEVEGWKFELIEKLKSNEK